MEDRALEIVDVTNDGRVLVCGVLDGHGGEEAVEFLRLNLPELLVALYPDNKNNIKEYFTQVFSEVNEKLRSKNYLNQGSCICLLLLRAEYKSGGILEKWGEESQEKRVVKAYTANLGDTRAVLNKKREAIRLSYDHKATDLQEQ